MEFEKHILKKSTSYENRYSEHKIRMEKGLGTDGDIVNGVSYIAYTTLFTLTDVPFAKAELFSNNLVRMMQQIRFSQNNF
jgi:YidC/Oxa1 family membrane protein insertase